jgi:hypothetical protein
MTPGNLLISAAERSRRMWILATVLLIALLPMATVRADDSAPATQPAVSDAEFDTALEKASTLSGTELQQDLIPVASRFRTVDVCTSAGRNMWSFRTLNERGKGFDAVRFTVPSGKATHFFWAFSIPNQTRWYIEPLKGEHKPLFKKFFGPDLAKYDLPAAINKDLILQEIPDRLEPGCEYVLWFKLDTTKPVRFAGSLVLLDQESNGNMYDIEDAVGLKETGDGKYQSLAPRSLPQIEARLLCRPERTTPSHADATSGERQQSERGRFGRVLGGDDDVVAVGAAVVIDLEAVSLPAVNLVEHGTLGQASEGTAIKSNGPPSLAPASFAIVNWSPTAGA